MCLAGPHQGRTCGPTAISVVSRLNLAAEASWDCCSCRETPPSRPYPLGEAMCIDDQSIGIKVAILAWSRTTMTDHFSSRAPSGVGWSCQFHPLTTGFLSLPSTEDVLTSWALLTNMLNTKLSHRTQPAALLNKRIFFLIPAFLTNKYLI